MESRHKRARILAVRWLLYVVLLLCAAALQTTPGFLTIGDFKPFFIPAVCLAVSMYEGEFYGALFGAVGGLLWDYTGGRTVGLLAIMLLMLCFFASVLVQLYLKPSWVNFFLINLAVGGILLCMDFLFFYVMRGYDAPLRRFAAVVVPEVLVSAALSPLMLRLTGWIHARWALPE